MISPYVFAGIGEEIYPPKRMEGIIPIIEKYLITNYNVPVDFLTNKCHKQEYVHARYVFFYMVIQNKNNMSQLGKLTGYDHSTIFWGVNKVKEYIKEYKKGKYINDNFMKFNKIILL